MSTIDELHGAQENGAEPHENGVEPPLLDLRHLVQEFTLRDFGGVKGGTVKAVSDVSLTIQPGETLGLVGETGSGKTTLARTVLQAPKPKSGQVLFHGVDLTKLRRRELRRNLRGLQAVFQDPYGSLNPKWRVRDIVEEPLIGFKVGTSSERKRRVNEVLDLVGLDPSVFGPRRPRSLSGGQGQRVAIARALSLSPSLIICDEAVSSLDVLIQAQVLNLFEELRTQLHLSYLFVAHDLAIVKQVSDRVAVLYLGKLCEVGDVESLYQTPLHPYTEALLASVPNPDPTAERASTEEKISGELPSPVNPPSGCRFRTRCPRAQERCAEEEPEMRTLGPNHTVACHFPLNGAVAPPTAATPVSLSGAAPAPGV
ncbi:MAG: ABC transporter ATP-binding protein [Acidimicrobiales bacterium]|nr:ABC transporter ATP-binding protein [Acidimicrobiales bacterium]